MDRSRRREEIAKTLQLHLSLVVVVVDDSDDDDDGDDDDDKSLRNSDSEGVAVGVRTP